MARKSKVRIEGESAMLNLNTIIEIYQNERNAAVIVYHAADCRRWCKSIIAAGLELPNFIEENRKFLTTHGWF